MGKLEAEKIAIQANRIYTLKSSYGDVQHADGSTPGVGGKEEVRKMNKQFYCKQSSPSVLSSSASILHVL